MQTGLFVCPSNLTNLHFYVIAKITFFVTGYSHGRMLHQNNRSRGLELDIEDFSPFFAGNAEWEVETTSRVDHTTLIIFIHFSIVRLDIIIYSYLKVVCLILFLVCQSRPFEQKCWWARMSVTENVQESVCQWVKLSASVFALKFTSVLIPLVKYEQCVGF